MRHIPIVLLALTCVACASMPLPGGSGGSPAPGSSVSGPLSAIADSAAAPLTATPTAAPVSVQEAGLTFALPSADDLRAMQASGFTGDVFLTFRPSISGTTSTATQLENGNFGLDTYFPSPFSQGEGVTSVLTAHVQPPGQSPIDTYAQTTIQPIIRAWGGDAALYTNYQWTPNLGDLRAGIVRSHDPNAFVNEAAIVKNVGWPLAYLSPSRHEALFFYSAGVVLRAQWAKTLYTEQNVPVSLAIAIKSVVADLRDPNAQSEEARTGLDHFLGVPYAGVFGPPSVNRHDDLVPTFDVPDEIPWSGFLSTEYANKPVWYINSTWGGGGLVDALTGAVIRFTRLRVGHGTGGPPSPFIPPAP